MLLNGNAINDKTRSWFFFFFFFFTLVTSNLLHTGDLYIIHLSTCNRQKCLITLLISRIWGGKIRDFVQSLVAFPCTDICHLHNMYTSIKVHKFLKILYVALIHACFRLMKWQFSVACGRHDFLAAKYFHQKST